MNFLLRNLCHLQPIWSPEFVRILSLGPKRDNSSLMIYYFTLLFTLYSRVSTLANFGTF